MSYSMSNPLFSTRCLTVYFSLSGSKAVGLSLPPEVAPEVSVDFPAGSLLGYPTGQRHTDGEGNTQRIEIALTVVHHLRLMAWAWSMKGTELFSALLKLFQVEQCPRIWVKPEDVATIPS